MEWHMPYDYMVDVLRVDLAGMGCSRVILLGDERDMGEPALKVGLARWGVQVLTPPAVEQVWIAGLAEGHGAARDRLDRLSTMLADGIEHGVEAIVATTERMAEVVRLSGVDVPVLVPNPRGSIVPVRNVVFDMGGVLFQWDPVGMARRVCETDADAQLLAKVVFDSREWVLYDAGAIDEQTIIWAAKTRVPRRLYRAVEELVQHWHEHRSPVDGASELIADLKQAGFDLYLLTNVGESFHRYKTQLPGYECFSGMVLSSAEHVCKPDSRIYRTLFERYGLVAQECLFVDDSQVNVLGARRVGMRGWHFDGSTEPLRTLLLSM